MALWLLRRMESGWRTSSGSDSELIRGQAVWTVGVQEGREPSVCLRPSQCGGGGGRTVARGERARPLQVHEVCLSRTHGDGHLGWSSEKGSTLGCEPGSSVSGRCPIPGTVDARRRARKGEAGEEAEKGRPVRRREAQRGKGLKGVGNASCCAAGYTEAEKGPQDVAGRRFPRPRGGSF